MNIQILGLLKAFTMTKKLRTYSNDFKAEAVKKIADNDGNISATAKQLGIAMQTLSNMHKP